MKRNLAVALLLAGVAACGVQLYAHHSFTATYFEDKKVKIEGKLITFQFRNPHSFVTVEAPDDQGMCSAGASNGAEPANLAARALPGKRSNPAITS